MNPTFAIPQADRPFSNGEGENLLSSIDVIFARFLEKISGEQNPYLAVAAALLSKSVRDGNICLDLHDLPAMNTEPYRYNNIMPIEDQNPLAVSNLEDWQKGLRKSSVVGRPGEFKPLILDDALRLYLFRYWEYETQLADFLRASARQRDLETVRHETAACKAKLDMLFPDSPNEKEPTLNWQKVAACAVLVNRLTVISGGPGTGKTSVIARAVILLIELSGQKAPRIALAAPTGKAAQRLQEAVLKAAEDFVGDRRIFEAIPKQATTIHRLIGHSPQASGTRWNRENPLNVDIVVIDEASMIDLALMVQLIRALPEHARLILLGDRDQLASVEAGAVLGDICGYGELNDFSEDFAAFLSGLTGEKIVGLGTSQRPHSVLRNSVIELRRNYRFSAKSSISRLSAAIKKGAGEEALCILQENDDSCRWRPLSSLSDLSLVVQEAMGHFTDYFDMIADSQKYTELFRIFDRRRILCALRRGTYGVIEVNSLCEQALRQRGLITGREPFYPGRPVMIARNDYRMKLFNGDVGFILPDTRINGDLSAFFRSEMGELRRFTPFRLPEHETVYALTVHKSQGSEFNDVLLILPDYDAPVLTRELIYTAVTRAKSTVTICGREDVFIAAVSRRMERSSGLRDALGAP